MIIIIFFCLCNNHILIIIYVSCCTLLLSHSRVARYTRIMAKRSMYLPFATTTMCVGQCDISGYKLPHIFKRKKKQITNREILKQNYITNLMCKKK